MELAERLSARLVALLPLRLLAGDALPISDRRPGLSGEPVLSASGAYCVADERMLCFVVTHYFFLPPETNEIPGWKRGACSMSPTQVVVRLRSAVSGALTPKNQSVSLLIAGVTH